MSDSRLPGFYRLSVDERIDVLVQRGWLSPGDAERLRGPRQLLTGAAADRIVENVVGVFGLPFAVAPNFLVNDRNHVVPLVVEEPSIVAALSAAAALARATGGFRVEQPESLLAGQVHVTGFASAEKALAALADAKPSLLQAANEVHPRLAGRGGGVRDIEFRELTLPSGEPLIAVHLLVDTCDAMGANLVNTICEALAPAIAARCEGEVALRILSNLADRAVVTARVRYGTDDLASDDYSGESLRDAIVRANEIASVDPHRAATHNKGIMNGIDAVAVATGNDWRAIEAGAHAFAAASGRYLPLTRWWADDNGYLCGALSLPLKVGTVGGTVAANPAAAVGLALSGVESAIELAELMAAVGLAQNFGALRALVTSGIQSGHMKLHARSVAASIGTPEEHFDAVVERLVDSGDVKSWRAEQLLAEVRSEAVGVVPTETAAGKVILFGEHAVVYGRHALALPVPGAVGAGVERAGTLEVRVPAWGISRQIARDAPGGIDAAIMLILRELGIGEAETFCISVDSRLPPGMGLGSSAAVAVAVTRALAHFMDLPLDDARTNAIAFACEKIAHGTPSGIDNTVSTYAEPMLFRNTGSLDITRVEAPPDVPLVIACSSAPGLTSEMVAGVRERYRQVPARYEALFDEMDDLAVQGAALLAEGAYTDLGRLMNICHGLLNAIGISNPELEHMVAVARRYGAAGAKLTGAGGGGSIVAICPDGVEKAATALQHAGYRTLQLPV